MSLLNSSANRLLQVLLVQFISLTMFLVLIFINTTKAWCINYFTTLFSHSSAFLQMILAFRNLYHVPSMTSPSCHHLVFTFAFCTHSMLISPSLVIVIFYKDFIYSFESMGVVQSKERERASPTHSPSCTEPNAGSIP